MIKISCAILGLMLLIGVAAGADEIVIPLPAEDQQRINSLLGPGVLGSALPSGPIEDTARYFPLVENVRTYQVTAGSKTGSKQTLSLVKSKRPNGRQAWRFQLTPTLVGYITPTPPGDLIMTAVSDTGEGVVVVSTPPNPFIVKGIKPGETRSYSQQVAVNYLDDPSNREYSGSLHGTFTYLGTYHVTVPAGTYDAVLFREKFEGKVGPAQTQDTQYSLFAPGVGLVAMITQESIEAFWIYHNDTTTGKVLFSR